MTARQITFGDIPLSNNQILESAAPASFGSTGSITTAFIGDLSKVGFSTGKQITGSTTLGQPTSGYSIRPEDSIRFDYLYSSSGFNNSTSSNAGRTGAAVNYIKADNYGQGDTFCYYANSFVSGAKAGATSFLANPAAVLFAGGASAGQDGVYLNPVEINTNDGGFDVAAINFVANQNRNNDTGALGSVWFGFRSQSQGTKPIDAHFSASGAAKIGLDLSGFTSNASGAWQQAALAVKGGDRIYLNATTGGSPGYAAPGSTYIYYDTGNTGIEAVVGGSAMFLFTASSAFLYPATITIGQAKNNKLQVVGVNSGAAPSLSVVASSDTNQDLKIAALGTGNIQFNNAGSFSANGSVATALSSIGPTGSHATVQEWLTIKNASGVVRYIPCF